MQNVNRVILVGKLGVAPVLRTTRSGMAVCQLRLATHRRTKKSDDSGYRLETQWHTVVVWGRSGEACAAYLNQGSLIYVEGRIRTQLFTDRAGVQRTSIEIDADRVQFLDIGERVEKRAEAETEVMEDAGDARDVPVIEESEQVGLLG